MAELFVMCALYFTAPHGGTPFYFCSKHYDLPCRVVNEVKWDCQTYKHAPKRRGIR